jgi:hypothetical protein
MRTTANPWPPSALLLVVAAIMVMGTGFYFVLLRPTLLPEDIRYMGLTTAQLDSVRVPLAAWLTHVFRVMGGYVLATGVLAMTLALTSYREHRGGAGVGALLGGIASIGLMSAVNFMIQSDFKWVLLCMALVWAASIILFWRERYSLPMNPGIYCGGALPRRE